ncbi:MAG TPA: hypothetical protein VN843_16985 [Anaerolineales bacterium]|nr:hypothetical protein [Anaerolineales bacterium]
MAREVIITHHAEVRMRERYHKDPEHLKRVIHGFKAVRLNTLNGVTGYLIYDDELHDEETGKVYDGFFIIVLDERNRAIITILTLEQGMRSSWSSRLTTKNLFKAIDSVNASRAPDKIVDPKKCVSRYVPIEKTVSRKFNVTVCYKQEKFCFNPYGTFKGKFHFDTSMFRTDTEGVITADWESLPGRDVLRRIVEKANQSNIEVEDIISIEVDMKRYGTVGHPNNEI